MQASRRTQAAVVRVAIVGGGLGGLAAALFLRQAGLEATVYEQAPELREVGFANGDPLRQSAWLYGYGLPGS